MNRVILKYAYPIVVVILLIFAWVVYTRISAGPNDVLVLRFTDANPVTLGTALRVLNQLRMTTGVVPERAAVLPVHADSMPESWNRTGLRERAVEDLISLMRASPSDVPGIGLARTMTISLLAPTSAH